MLFAATTFEQKFKFCNKIVSKNKKTDCLRHIKSMVVLQKIGLKKFLVFLKGSVTFVKYLDKTYVTVIAHIETDIKN